MLMQILSWTCSAVFLIIVSYIVVDTFTIKKISMNALIGRIVLLVILLIITVVELVKFK